MKMPALIFTGCALLLATGAPYGWLPAMPFALAAFDCWVFEWHCGVASPRSRDGIGGA